MKRKMMTRMWMSECNLECWALLNCSHLVHNSGPLSVTLPSNILLMSFEYVSFSFVYKKNSDLDLDFELGFDLDEDEDDAVDDEE